MSAPRFPQLSAANHRTWPIERRGLEHLRLHDYRCWARPVNAAAVALLVGYSRLAGATEIQQRQGDNYSALVHEFFPAT